MVKYRKRNNAKVTRGRVNSSPVAKSFSHLYEDIMKKSHDLQTSFSSVYCSDCGKHLTNAELYYMAMPEIKKGKIYWMIKNYCRKHMPPKSEWEKTDKLIRRHYHSDYPVIGKTHVGISISGKDFVKAMEGKY